MQNNSEINHNCPCGSGELYQDCCEPLILGTQPAPTAVKLMRSRYTAYVKQEIEYILLTTYPEQRTEHDAESIRKWSETSYWQKLEVISTKAGSTGDNEGWVEFIAYYSEKRENKQHHEISYFKKLDGKRFYVNGVNPVKQAVGKVPSVKIGRNDPCHCGSGMKYKKCCGKVK
jgi:SEC-C motif-containing protein